jgi:inorganic pyrophosphatase
MNLANIPLGEHSPDIVPAVIEIPRRSRNKYSYDLDLEVFRLKRVIHSAVEYPTSYGFIPSTAWDDDEPLDVMVLGEEDFEPGVVVMVRPIGLIVMKDREITDSKILSVPVNDPRYSDIGNITDVSAHLLREIEHFFESYKHLEGHDVKSFGWSPCLFARNAILRGSKEYEKRGVWGKAESANSV